MSEEMNNKIKGKQAINEELEIQEIFQNSEETKGQRLLFDDLTKNLKTEDEVKALIFGNEIIDNPQSKHTIYYHGIEKMLRLITGSKKDYNAPLDILREEKKIFLARGKQKDAKGVRHFDVRQAFETDMDAAYNIILKAITKGLSAYDLYIEFRNENINLGYYDYLLESNAHSIAYDARLLDIYRELKERKRKAETEELLAEKKKPLDEAGG